MDKDGYEAFVDALGLKKVDLFGYSLGGFVAQVIAKERPTLVRKIILAGTGPAGGAGIARIGEVLQTAMQRSAAEKKHPKTFLFFTPSLSSQNSAGEFLTRLSERTADKDATVTNESTGRSMALFRCTQMVLLAREPSPT